MKTVFADTGYWIDICASFYIMQQKNIREALAYAKHIEQAGFIALLRDR